MQKYIIAKKFGNTVRYLQTNPYGTPTYIWYTNYADATTWSTKNLAISYIKNYYNGPKNNSNLMVLPVIITIDRPIYNSKGD